MSPRKSVHRGTQMVDRKPCGPVVVAGENCRGMNPDIFSLATSRRGKVSPGTCHRGKLFFVPGDNDEQYSGFKLPSSIHNLGLSYFPESSIQFVDPLLDQLRELDLRWLDDPLPQVWSCQCYILHRCLNLEVLHTDYVCGNIRLGCISKLCKKLRKLTVYSGTRVGLMAVAQGCPNLEYLHVELTNISNEALECIGSNLKNLRVFYIRVQQQEDEEYNTILPLDNGIRAMLIGCAKLVRLSLDLYPEVLTNVGLGFFSKYGVNLRFLSLASIGGSDEGLIELLEGCPKLRYIWFKSGNDTGLTLTRPDFDMLAQLQMMREQTARLKAGVEWAAQEAARSQNTFKDFLAHFNRHQSRAGCSSSYTPPPMYTPQAVPD
ncbi:zinc finger, CCHC-type containing protein, partial [Tanacetum coccineum]